jgi:chromosome segregation ATPase
MVMTDTSSTASTSSGSRLVTVDDLRYELQRERAITDAHFMRITSHVESLDHRLAELSHDMSRRFTEAREYVDHRFTSVDARFEQIDIRFEQIDRRFDSIDARFEQIDIRFEQIDRRFDSIDARFEQVDTRFNRLEARLDARFDALDERLRFNKTLIVASLSAAASVASVFVSLLK